MIYYMRALKIFLATNNDMFHRSSLVSPMQMVQYAIELYRQEWKMFLRIALWFVAPLVAIHILTSIFYFGAWNIIFFIPFGVLLYGLQLIAHIGMIVFVVNRDKRHYKTSWELLDQTFRVIFPVLVVISLATVFVLLMALGFILPGNIVFDMIGNASFIIRIGVMGVLWVPALSAAVWFAFALYALIDKPQSPLRALMASRNVVKHRFISVVWRLIASFILFLIPLTILLIGVLVLVGVTVGSPWVGISQGAESIWWAQVITNSIAMGGMPLFVASFWRLYQGLQETH